MRLLILVLLLVPFSLNGQPSLFDVLHTRPDTAVLRIDTEWSKLARNKRDKSYQPATVELMLGDSLLSFKARIRSRGNVRLEVCQNPSLKLKLKKSELLAAGFSDLNEFKFVLQCNNTSMGEGYLTKERLVYDLHALFSDFTHRTIPVGLDFGEDQLTQAFLIEHEEQIAARLNVRVLDTKRVSTRGLQKEAYVNMCLFNYLILNTDWHVSNLHNLVFISPEGSLDIIPIPYDFDYSGFVGTHYAVPHETFQIGTVYVPLWLGQHVTPAEIKTAAEHYLSRRSLAISLINDHPTLHKRDRKRILKRLDDFYELLEDEKRLFRLLE